MIFFTRRTEPQPQAMHLACGVTEVGPGVKVRRRRYVIVGVAAESFPGSSTVYRAYRQKQMSVHTKLQMFAIRFKNGVEGKNNYN